MMDFLGSIGSVFGQAILPSLATVIAGFVVLLVKRLAGKYQIELTNQQEERLKQMIRDAVHHAEEEAHRNPDLTSKEKAAIAVNDVLVRAADDPTIPPPPKPLVDKLIDSVLSQLRAAGKIPATRHGLDLRTIGEGGGETGAD